MVKREAGRGALLILSGVLALTSLLGSCRRDDVEESKDAAVVAKKLLMESGRREVRWTEEVKLHDGRIVQLERSARKIEDTLLNPTGGRLDGNDLFYRPLNVRWKSAPRSADWVLAFDVFDGVPHLVLDGAGWQYCKGNPPAFSGRQKWS